MGWATGVAAIGFPRFFKIGPRDINDLRVNLLIL